MTAAYLATPPACHQHPCEGPTTIPIPIPVPVPVPVEGSARGLRRARTARSRTTIEARTETRESRRLKKP